MNELMHEHHGWQNSKRTVMKYRIIEEAYPVDLEREVNKAIEQGWKPIGGVCSDSAYGSGTSIYQAMIFGGEE